MKNILKSHLFWGASDSSIFFVGYNNHNMLWMHAADLSQLCGITRQDQAEAKADVSIALGMYLDWSISSQSLH